MNLLQQLILGPIRRASRGSTDRRLPVRAPPSRRDSPCSARHAEAIAQAAALAQGGNLARSLSLLTERLTEDPGDAELLYARALTLSDWGRLRESLEDLRAAEAHGFSSIGLHLNMAQVCHLLGSAEEAERRARRALAVDPNSGVAHLCLAMVLQSAKRYDDASRSYERAYQLAPDRVDCMRNIAACKLDQKDALGAEDLIRQAISLDGGDQAKSWGLLGIALSLQNRCSEAVEAFDRAEEIEARTGQPAETFVLHGFHLWSLGLVRDAIDLYERVLPSRPHPGAQAHYGFTLLTAGRYREGWAQYEFRRTQDWFSSVRPRFGRPAWNGQDLNGKTILVWAEQGIGDTVQFARFAQVLKAKGASVVLHVPAQLKEVAHNFLGVDRVILDAKEISTGFDYQIATMSLPCALGIDLTSVPAEVPYLRTDPERAARWHERVGSSGQLKVGLVWAGNPKHENDRHRSMPSSLLAGLWGIEGVRFFSLQKERRDGDEAQLPFDAGLVDLAPHLQDLREAAAAIAALDLVITVDTAVAHVAGALGKPVWTLLPAAADFRWLRDREDSPWYPTMRLFRQRELGKWDEVVARVSQALREAVHAPAIGTRARALRPTASRRAPLPATEAETPRDSTLSQLSSVTETRYGIVQYVHSQETLARSLAWYGEWLQPQLDLLLLLLRPGATVIEAGSGIGVHALALVQIMGPTGHLFVHEADAMLRRILNQNLQANGVRKLVTALVRDLAAPSIERPHGLSDASTAVLQGAAPPEHDTVDDLLLSRLDLLKINDGALAREIIDGATDTLWRSRPLLFIGLSEGANLDALAGYVKTFSYRCWRMTTPLFLPNNYNRRDDDILGGREVLALVAAPEEIDLQVALERCDEV